MHLDAYIKCAWLIYIYMTAIFLIALVKKNNSIVDIAWGIGFIAVALFTFFNYNTYFYHGHYSWQQTLSTLLVIIWGLRLSGYIAIRNWGKSEDPRYKAWRDEWGKHEQGILYVIVRSFFQIFMLQGTILLIIISPVIAINTHCGIVPFSLIAFCGLLVWIIGFLYENIGDYQLYMFLKNPKNHGCIMTQGLWKYTRHPNYFGEATMWWGMWLIAWATTPYAFYTIISPTLITYLLLYVSGVALAEKPFENNTAYKEYQRKTSRFFPLPQSCDTNNAIDK